MAKLRDEKALMERLLTTTAAAERIGTTQGTVRVWLNTDPGRFPNARRFGNTWLIPEGDLKGFVLRPRGRPPKETAPRRRRAR